MYYFYSQSEFGIADYLISKSSCELIDPEVFKKAEKPGFYAVVTESEDDEEVLTNFAFVNFNGAIDFKRGIVRVYSSADKGLKLKALYLPIRNEEYIEIRA